MVAHLTQQFVKDDLEQMTMLLDLTQLIVGPCPVLITLVPASSSGTTKDSERLVRAEWVKT